MGLDAEILGHDPESLLAPRRNLVRGFRGDAARQVQSLHPGVSADSLQKLLLVHLFRGGARLAVEQHVDGAQPLTKDRAEGFGKALTVLCCLGLALVEGGAGWEADPRFDDPAFLPTFGIPYALTTEEERAQAGERASATFARHASRGTGS
jgi:hypothetical protein